MCFFLTKYLNMQNDIQCSSNLSEEKQCGKKKSSKKKKIIINRENLVRKEEKHVSLYYEIGEEIGSGSFGKVFKIKHKKFQENRALKVVNKVEKENYTSFEELEILKKLDHPNILKIYEYYESPSKWYIVTEFFEGNQLFDEIIGEGSLSQKKAALIFAQILKAIACIHNQGIAHRDIKPENILVHHESQEKYQIKVIDWGLGAIAGKELFRKCGTPQYCAPEVINGNYGYKCDLWSLGVLLYVMLIGKFPFKGDTVSETLEKVSIGKINYSGEEWEDISLPAKTLVRQLLQKDPKKRLNASQCLKHEWILENASSVHCSDSQLKETLIRIKQFAIENKFQAVVINFLHNYISTPKELNRLKQEFEALDTNNDGVLSYEELLEGYKKIYGEFDAQKIVEDIFLSLDLDGNGFIQYSQFVTFAARIHQRFSHDQLKEAFRLFDHDNDGRIDRKEINSLLMYQKGSQSQEFDELLDEIDLNKDGSIDLDQFIQHINKAAEKVLEGKQDTPK